MVDDHHAIAEQLDLGQDVRRQNKRRLPRQVTNQLADSDDLLRVETHRRLVQNENLGLMQDRGRQTHPLAVAFGQRADDLPFHFLQKTALDHLADPLPRFAARQAFETRAVGEVLADPHLGIERHVFRQVAQILARRDRIGHQILAVDGDATASRWQKAGDHPQRRRLSRTVGAQDADDLALVHRERNVIDRHVLTIATSQIGSLDHAFPQR